jgi:vancomycin permeability regulator SanA
MKDRVKKRLIIPAFILVAAVLMFVLWGIVLNICVVQSTKADIFDLEHEFSQDKTYDCIIVPGAGLKDDGTPSNMLEDRLRRASEVYYDGASDKILVTGDNGRMEYNETAAMKNYLVKTLGVPGEDVVCDYAGFSTYDSIYRARDVFCVKSAVVVTQKYHEYRALYIGDKLDLEVAGVASNQRKYFGGTYREARETLARFKDFFKVLIHANPALGGDVIPISGSGVVSHGE